MRKWIKRLFLLGILAICGLAIGFPWLFDSILGPAYDLLTGQEVVNTPEQLEKVLDSYPRISYEELMAKGLAKGDRLSEMKLYQNKEFLLIQDFGRYRYLVGKQRAHQFLHSQRVWRLRLPRFGRTQYLLIDKKAIEKLLQFRQQLKKEKLDQDAFVVTSGFRPPAYNKRVGGKPKSRHLHGQAIDIVIQDLNRDGKSNPADRDLAYQLLDTKIIRSFGGLGKYKSDKRVLHLDSRGYRARWHY